MNGMGEEDSGRGPAAGLQSDGLRLDAADDQRRGPDYVRDHLLEHEAQPLGPGQGRSPGHQSSASPTKRR